MAETTLPTPRRRVSGVGAVRKVKKASNTTGITLLALFTLILFLIPMFYGIVTSLKTDTQISAINGPLYPASERNFNYEGVDYPVYKVPDANGVLHEWALVKKGRLVSQFVDTANPGAGLITWEGNWRQLQAIWVFDAQWKNFSDAWSLINYPQLLRNTLMYGILSTIGAVSSAAVVAYGFARFRIPKKNILFIIVMGSIILPPAVTLIPTYTVFYRIGWVNTWLPLIVPAFFSNGYNIFLLRQFFLAIPKELDEAATIDGANPWQIFTKVILPQSIPALTAVTLFHFFYCWNDYFGPLIYLVSAPNLLPISVGLYKFNSQYTQATNLIQAGALISAVIPLIMFFFAQRSFMQGVVITGVEK